MAELCTDRFLELADRLGGIPCEEASPVGYLKDPRTLTDPTMPVVELLIAVGFVLALAHAWRLHRRNGDATGLGVCLAAATYVLVLEPPLYFPALFGLDGYLSAVFVHNEFTVGLLYNRLPLYILLLYPTLVYLAWTLVRLLGVRERRPGVRGLLVTAVCVGAVHQAFYAVFDQYGPSHAWWAWDEQARSNALLVGDVPLSIAVNFALVMPAAFALTCLVLLGRRPRRTVRSVLGPAVLCGVLTPFVSIPGQLPVTYLDLVDVPSYDAVRAVLYAVLLLATAVLLREVVAAWRADRPAGDGPGVLRWYAPAYLALWLAAFAVLGVVSPPAGVVAYLVPCWAVSLAVLATTARAVRGRTATAAEPEAVAVPA